MTDTHTHTSAHSRARIYTNATARQSSIFKLIQLKLKLKIQLITVRQSTVRTQFAHNVLYVVCAFLSSFWHFVYTLYLYFLFSLPCFARQRARVCVCECTVQWPHCSHIVMPPLRSIYRRCDNAFVINLDLENPLRSNNITHRCPAMAERAYDIYVNGVRCVCIAHSHTQSLAQLFIHFIIYAMFLIWFFQRRKNTHLVSTPQSINSGIRLLHIGRDAFDICADRVRHVLHALCAIDEVLSLKFVISIRDRLTSHWIQILFALSSRASMLTFYLELWLACALA